MPSYTFTVTPGSATDNLTGPGSVTQTWHATCAPNGFPDLVEFGNGSGGAAYYTFSRSSGSIAGGSFTGTLTLYYGYLPTSHSDSFTVALDDASIGGEIVNGPSTIWTVNYTPVGPPTVTAIIPNRGTKAGGETVTIIGTGFDIYTNNMTVQFGPNMSSLVTVVSATELTAVVPAYSSTGPVNVVVDRVPDSQSVTVVNGFTYTLMPLHNSCAEFWG